MTSKANPAPDPSGAADAQQELTFEQALAELEAVVHRLEEGRLSLSDSMASYEIGVQRLRHCYRLLQGAESRIEQLLSVDPAGQAKTVPLVDAGADDDLDQKKQSRARRRTAPERRSTGSDRPAAGKTRTDGLAGPKGSDDDDVDEARGLF